MENLAFLFAITICERTQLSRLQTGNAFLWSNEAMSIGMCN